MNLSKKDLERVAGQGIITTEQAEALWKHLEADQSQRSHFSASHVVYYFGAFIVISAMSWFMTLAWEQFGGAGIFIIASLYALCFCLAGRTLWKQGAFQIPGGLLVTLAVCMTPLAVYGLEKWSGFWPQDTPDSYRDYHIYVRGSWIVMELATILAGAVALWFVRFPFLTAPIAFSLWYLSMDLTPMIFGAEDYTWEQRKWVSVALGLVMLLATFLTERRTDKDYAFWGYLFGLIAFSGGLSFMNSDSQWGKILYCLIHLGLMIISVLLERKVFLIFGALGVFGYLSYLAYHVFENSLIFPFALTILGIGIIFLGVQFQKHGDQLRVAIMGRLPQGFAQRFR